MIMAGIPAMNYTPGTVPILRPDKSLDELFEAWDCIKSFKRRNMLCYSRDDQLREYARRTAQCMKQINQNALSIHEYENQRLWYKRCKRCRKRFGDDRVAGMANYFRIFHEEIRKVLPEANVFYITIPYLASASGQFDAIKQYSEILPFDEHTYVCVREASRDQIRDWRDAWGWDKRHWYYINLVWGWNVPMYSTVLSTMKTFYFNKPDIVWPCFDRPGRSMPLHALQFAEFSWNTHAPGSRYWPDSAKYKSSDETTNLLGAFGALPETPEDFYHLRRICRELWGDEAAETMMRVLDRGLNSGFISDPEYFRKTISRVSRNNNLPEPDYEGEMFKQRDAARRAVAALTKVLAQVGEIAPFGQKYFSHYYKRVHLCRMLVEARCLLIEGRRLIEAGTYGEAEHRLARASAALREGRERMEEIVATDLEGLPSVSPGWKGLRLVGGEYRGPQSATSEDRIAHLEKVIDQTWKQREAIRTAAGIRARVNAGDAAAEAMIRAAQTPRTIRAGAVKKEPVIDGRPDDDCWEQAVWVKGFYLHDSPKPAVQQTEAAICYGPDALYIAFRCSSRFAETSTDTAHERDKWLPKENYVEVFLRPDETTKDHLQFIVNTLGPRGEYYFRAQPGGGWQENPGAWNAKWQAGVVREDKQWTAELRIPVAVFASTEFGEKARPGTGSKWHINLARSTPGSLGNEYSALASYDYRDIEHFSTLVFE